MSTRQGKAIILTITCLLTVFLSTKTFGADFHVTTTDELRNALMTAQSNGEDDTINLSAGIYTTGSASFSCRPAEDKKVTIQAETGLSADDVILDGEETTRVLYIFAENYEADIEIKNITIRNGKKSDILSVGGGGIYIKTDATVTISDCIIKDNYVEPSDGGGCYVEGATITTISNSTFIENIGVNGGGLYVKENANILNSIFIRNNASIISYYTTGSKNGGGLYVGGDASISNSSFNENSCDDSGGGIYVVLKDATVSNSTFKENTAKRYGGAIQAGSLNLTSSTIISNNTTQKGGGVYVSHRATLINNIIAKNSAIAPNESWISHGGGIYFVGSDNIVLTNNTITENEATNNGDGIYLEADSDVKADLYNNIIYNNDTDDIFIEGMGPVYAYNNDYGTLGGQYFTAWGDNIQEDPLFVNTTDDDYHIQSSSPCINAGHASAPELPETDFEGDTRDSPPDIGADEIPGTASISTTTTVVGGCEVVISPDSGTVLPGGTIQFTATTYCNSEEAEGTYTWEINSTIGSTISANGLYIAGNTDGTDTVRVTDTDHGDISANSLVIVSQTATTTITISSTTTAVTSSTTTTTPQAITVDFQGSPTFGFAPLTVNFFNLSSGDISSYLWNFGDGSTSNEENPTHLYTGIGNYAVSLTAFGINGSSEEEIKPNYVFVLPGCPLMSALDNQEDIETLRTLRDSLLNNIFGLILTSIYYQNSAEVATILAENPELQDKLRDLVSKNIVVALFLNNGVNASVSENNVEEFIEFLNNLKSKGSPRLRADINLVIEAIKAGYFLYGLGVSVE